MIRESVPPETIAQEHGLDPELVRSWKASFLEQLKTATKGVVKRSTRSEGARPDTPVVTDISRKRVRKEDAKRPPAAPLVPFPSQPGTVPLLDHERNALEETRRLILRDGQISEVGRKLGMMPKEHYEPPTPQPISEANEGAPPETPEISGEDQARFAKNWEKLGTDAPPLVDPPRPITLTFRERLITRLQDLPIISWFLRGGRFDSVWITLLLLLVLGGTVFWFVRDAMQYGTETASPDAPNTTPRYLQPLTHEDIEEAKALIRQFYAVRNVEDFEPLIRRPNTVMPLLRRYYILQPIRQHEVENFENHRRADLPGLDVTMHQTALGLMGTRREVAIEHTSQGPKVDWEVAVGYQPMEWQKWRLERPTTTTYFRLTLQPSTYFGVPFNDPTIFRSFRLIYPGELRAVNGFAMIGTDAELRLRDLIPDEDANAQVVVGVQFPPSRTRDTLVEITVLVADSWVVPYEEGERHFDLPGGRAVNGIQAAELLTEDTLSAEPLDEPGIEEDTPSTTTSGEEAAPEE